MKVLIQRQLDRSNHPLARRGRSRHFRGYPRPTNELEHTSHPVRYFFRFECSPFQHVSGAGDLSSDSKSNPKEKMLTPKSLRPGCTIANAGFSGTLRTSNCDVNAAGQGQNEGCTIISQDTNSYGPVFNANGSGVFATEFSDVAIRMWFWPRSHVPLDIMAGIPEPRNWGIPVSSFGGGCDIKRFFAPQQIVLNLNFCGDWAGYFWKGACAEKAMTCRDYVANNPEAFREAYWSIYSLRDD